MLARATTWIVCGIAGGLVALLAQRLLEPPMAFAAVDLTALVTEHMKAQASTGGAATDIGAAAGRFAVQLDKETKRLADEYGVTLLAAPAVIAGIPDMTPLLRARLQLPPLGATAAKNGTVPPVTTKRETDDRLVH